MKKKILLIIMFMFALIPLSLLAVQAANKKQASALPLNQVESIDTSSNFYTQKENTTPIEIVDKESLLQLTKYKKISTVNHLSLYRKDDTMGIAIVDNRNGYTWFSHYENYKNIGLSKANRAKVESGVTIEYYDVNSDIFGEVELSLTQDKAECYLNEHYYYDEIENGFVAHITFPTVQISFDVEVYLTEDGGLVVNVPYESIVEEPIVGEIKTLHYELKSIIVFPYFGSQTYEINGYAFVPDGSGALIRYTDVASATSFKKRVYGDDYGFKNSSDVNSHIKNVSGLSLPVYGINHGYNQAAFLCEILSGDGAAELHSYPYNGTKNPINTTYFKLFTRDAYLVEFSDQSQVRFVNDEFFNNDYTLKYTFLSGDGSSDNLPANYVGMANAYRRSLGLTANNNSGDIGLHLDVLGVDYKQGLFGNNYIEMTKYKDALNIVKNLYYENVKNVQLTYIGWNKGGYFNDKSNAKVHRSLGSKQDLKNLISYINEKDMGIDFTVTPTLSKTYGFGNDSIKRINLSAFSNVLKSSLEQEFYYLNPSKLSDTILKNDKKYTNLGISGLNIDYLSNSYSYRHKSNVVYRSKMIDIITEELEQLEDYSVSTTTPNAYLFKYLENYYSSYYESSKYLYETDSIPFISILLSGYVNLYGPNMNYISDYDLLNLRMIEYNIAPSFIITNEEAHKLRFTNFEYLNSTQYALWKSIITSSYERVNGALSNVNGSHIISHRCIDKGIVEVTYSNDVVIYVNYNNYDYVNGSLSISAKDYLLKEGM